MIPATIHDLAAPRPVAHGEVMPQEIRVGQMLLAQSILGLTRRLDAFLAAVEREPELEEPEPVKAPRETKPAVRETKPPKAETPKASPAPARACDDDPEQVALATYLGKHAAPPAPVEVRSNGVPVDLALRYHEAYLDGAAARLTGALVETNPYTGDRGIAGGRRLAWLRGFREGAA